MPTFSQMPSNTSPPSRPRSAASNSNGPRPARSPGAQVLHELRADQREVGVGPRARPRGAVAQHAASRVEMEIAVAMERRVRHQPQMRQVIALPERERSGRGEREARCVDVARNDPEALVAVRREPRQRFRDAAGGLQRAAVVAPFHRVANAHAEARAVAEHGRELVFEPRGVDDDLGSRRRARAPRGATRSAACLPSRAAASACGR